MIVGIVESGKINASGILGSERNIGVEVLKTFNSNYLFIKFHVFLIYCIAWMAASNASVVSSPLGIIRLVGRTNPYLPVSLSSKAYEYLTPRTAYVQSILPPATASRSTKNYSLITATFSPTSFQELLAFFISGRQEALGMRLSFSIQQNL